MSRDTLMKIFAGFVTVGAGIGGGMAAGPVGAVVGGLVALTQFLSGVFHTQPGSTGISR